MCDCVQYHVVLGLLLCGLSQVGTFLVGCEPATCGEPVIQPRTSRIVGGQESLPGALPWTTMLVWCDYVRCGGAILNSQFIITAAHCFDEPHYPCFRLNSKDTRNPVNWTVFAGKHNVITQNIGEEMFEVEEILIHPLYNNRSHTNDVALLKLKTNITYSPLIRPICLPSETHVLTAGQPCIVAGYGETLQRETFSLNQVTVPIVSDEQCSLPDWYGTSYYAPPEQFCAGFEEGGKDACIPHPQWIAEGDSGSALICRFEGKWFASGIVSKGLLCADPKKPGVYTNVSYHHLWIRNAMAQYASTLPCF